MLKRCYYLILLICVLISSISTEKLPSYYKKCVQGSPDLSKCLIENAKNGIKQLANNGDPKWKLPNLTPVIVKKIELEASRSLKVVFTNAEFHGLNRIEFDDMDITLEKLYIQGRIKYMELLTDYELDGQILVLPIQGQGKLNVSISNLNVTYNAKLKSNAINGENYLTIDKGDKTTFEPGHLIWRFDHLFNGNKRLGDEMNKFLNENWKDVFDEIKESVTTTTASILKFYITGYFSKIPIKDLID